MKSYSKYIIIPARELSTRFPNKPLAKILGIPMVVRVANRCITAAGRENVIVTTDSYQIADVCRENNIRVHISSRVPPTGTDRVWECVKDLFDPDEENIYINVQGDEPLVDPKDINALFKAKVKDLSSPISGMSPIPLDSVELDDSSVTKVVSTGTGVLRRMVYISRSKIPGKHIKEAYRQYAMYGFTYRELKDYGEYYLKDYSKGVLEEQEDVELLRFIDLQQDVNMMIFNTHNISVDKPEDIRAVEYAIKQSL